MAESYKVGVVNTSTPGADANSYIMFDSTTWTIGPGCLPLWASRLMFTVENDQAGVLRAFRSSDKGANWDQTQADIVVAISAADTVNMQDFVVEKFSDFRLTWVNGGVAQTVWRPEIILTRGDRAAQT